jgi:hypothetical protein
MKTWRDLYLLRHAMSPISPDFGLLLALGGEALDELL